MSGHRSVKGGRTQDTGLHMATDTGLSREEEHRVHRGIGKGTSSEKDRGQSVKGRHQGIEP